MLAFAQRLALASLLLLSAASPLAAAIENAPPGEPDACVLPREIQRDPYLCVFVYSEDPDGFCLKESFHPPAPATWQDSTTCLPVSCPAACDLESPVWPSTASGAGGPKPPTACVPGVACGSVFTTWDWEDGEWTCAVYQVTTPSGGYHGNILCTVGLPMFYVLCRDVEGFCA